MGMLVINKEIEDRIAAIIAYSVAHPFTMDDMLDVLNNPGLCAGNNKEHTIIIPVNTKVVYSIEQQPKGDCRHISIGIPEPGKFPNIEIVKEIIKLFGFENKLEKCWVNFEDLGNNFSAISIIEPIKS